MIGAGEILGIDPLYVANEGKLVAFVAPEQADAALEAMRAHAGRRATPPSSARCATSRRAGCSGAPAFGGHRMIDMLVGDPLPRIC